MARPLLFRSAMSVGARSASLRGCVVRFRLADVVVPPAEELMHQLFGDDLLEGRVVDEKLEHGQRRGYVAVAVEGLATPVLVQPDKLVATTGSGAAC